uniref:VWFA domain-containing protein n=1 Tax=Steinernema glaseri TaxID=37863 RepID=A0A1I8AIX4_9BILA
TTTTPAPQTTTTKSSTTTPSGVTTTPSGVTTTPSGVTTTTTPAPQTTTTQGGICAPCNGKLAVILDTSNDLTETAFNAERDFIDNHLIGSTWTNFQKFSIGHYDSSTQINGFGTVTNKGAITGYFKFVCKYNPNAAPSLTKLFQSMKTQYGSSPASVIVFSSSADKNDIQNAKSIYDTVKATMNVVIVASGSYDPSLASIASTLVPWSADSNALRSQILAATKLDCSCGGGVTPTGVSTTVTPTGTPVQTPYKGEIIIMMDASSDVSQTQFDDQREFLSNDFITISWTDYSRFALGSYADLVNDFQAFGSLHSWKELILSITHQPYASKRGNIRIALEQVEAALRNADPQIPRMALVFTNTNDVAEIKLATTVSQNIANVTKLVVVALPGTDKTISSLQATVINWNNPDDEPAYGNLKQQILAASGLPYTGPGSTTTGAPTASPELPCAGQLFVIFDASGDLTPQIYVEQTHFLTQWMFSSDWTRYDRFAIAAYADRMDNFDSFNSIKGRNDLTTFIQAQRQAKALGNIRLALEWLSSTLSSSAHGIDSSTATVVFFTNTANKDDIKGAQQFMQKIEKYVTVVLVTLPETDPSISSLLPESNIVPWPKPGDISGDASLKKRILAVSGLKC